MTRLATEAFVDSVALPEYGTIAARPSAASRPDQSLYFATDDHGGRAYQVISGAWVQVTPGVNAESDISTLNSEVSTNTTNIATNAAAVATKAQALTPTSLKAANYAAAAGEFVPVDCSAGNITVTLPTAPPDKTRVGVKLIAVTGVYTVTIARGGTDVFNKVAGSTSLSLSYANQSTLLQYNASSGIWYVQSTDVPLGGLDTRYIAPTLVDAKGDLYVGTANDVVARKAVGADFRALIADASKTDGLDWKKLSDMLKIGGIDRIYPADLGSFIESFRSSDCYTASRIGAGANSTTTSGIVYASRAKSRGTKTYTQIRFNTGTTVPAGLTDVRAGVWDSSGNKLAETANIVGTVTLANNIYTINLLASLNLNDGDEVFLGIGFIGTTPPGIRGTSTNATAMLALTPSLTMTNTSSWTTGNVLPNLTTFGGSVVHPWMELL